MNEIKLSVKDENMQVILTILQNLKQGLIEDITTSNQPVKAERNTQYQPKTKTIIREEDSGTADTSGKYMNPTSYKQRLKR